MYTVLIPVVTVHQMHVSLFTASFLHISVIRSFHSNTLYTVDSAEGYRNIRITHFTTFTSRKEATLRTSVYSIY